MTGGLGFMASITQQRITVEDLAFDGIVGRTREIVAFDEILNTMTPQHPQILVVWGPSGIGKTALLRLFARRCQQNGTPYEFRAASSAGLTLSMLQGNQTPDGDGPEVLLVDDAGSTDPDLSNLFALRERFPALSLLVCSTEHFPEYGSSTLQTSPRSLHLGPLEYDASVSYLCASGVPINSARSVADFAEGYPLALHAFVSNLLGETATRVLDDMRLLATLSDRLRPPDEGSEQRKALDAAIVCHTVTEDLLESVTRTLSASELFSWLAELPYMRLQPNGLFMEGFARNLLGSDLLRRRPDEYSALGSRAREYFWERCNLAHGRAKHDALFQLRFLRRPHEVPIRAYDLEGLSSETLRSTDIDALTEIAREADGATSAEAARYWLMKQPETVFVVRSRDDVIRGFVAFVDAGRVTADDRVRDPSVDAACRYRQGMPSQSQERFMIERFFVVRGDRSCDYSPTKYSPAHVLLLNLAEAFLLQAQAGFSLKWRPEKSVRADWLRRYGILRVPEADVERDGEVFVALAHDWRAIPARVWLESVSFAAPDELPEIWQSHSTAVFDESTFRNLVRKALIDFDSGTALSQNPLIRSRLVATHAGSLASTEIRVAALREQIREAAAGLPTVQKSIRVRDLLIWTYLDVRGRQREIADLLNLPFSTYRDHLSRAQKALGDVLWAAEVAP